MKTTRTSPTFFITKNVYPGLDMLASVMPTPMEFAPGSDYRLAEPLHAGPARIPGLETPLDEKAAGLPLLASINVTDLFAKLVATGIVQNIQVVLASKMFKKQIGKSEIPLDFVCLNYSISPGP